MSLIRASLVAAALLVLGAPAWAGGNMRSSGEGMVYTSLKLDYGDRLFDKQGHVQSGSGCGTGVSNSWYGEYGASYYHTVFASTALDLNPCSSGKSTALGDTEVGIRGRVDEFSDRLIWETTLILPTANAVGRSGRTHSKVGVEFALHFDPRPDRYDLSIPRRPFDARWNFAGGVRLWADQTPAEGWLEAAWGRSLTLPDWRAGNGAWYLSARLRAAHSLWHTVRSDRAAIDPLDAYYLVTMSVSLSKQLSQVDSISVGVHHDLLGKNHSQSTGISIGYGHDFRN